MKKILKVDNFLIVVGILLAIGFAIRSGADYYQYHHDINTEPFPFLIIGRALTFLLPSIICFIIAACLKIKSTNKISSSK